jgi:hypothetical protein
MQSTFRKNPGDYNNFGRRNNLRSSSIRRSFTPGRGIRRSGNKTPTMRRSITPGRRGFSIESADNTLASLWRRLSEDRSTNQERTDPPAARPDDDFKSTMDQLLDTWRKRAHCRSDDSSVENDHR